MPYRLIVNPAAGSGKAQKLYKILEPWLDPRDTEVIFTDRPGHATKLAREVNHQENLTVISLGGDGTHHEVINGLMPEAKPIFAVIPAGTGNDFVRALAYSRSPKAMWDTATTGDIQSIDVGQVNDQYFLTVSGAGFDAEVAGWVNQHDKSGHGTWVFIRAILKHLVRYQSHDMTVYVNGASRTEPTFLLAIGNSAYYAGGMCICPKALVDDGLFNVVWVKDLPRVQVLPLLAKVFRGTHIQHRAVTTFQAEQLSLDGPPEMLVHADGEIVGHLPVTLRLVPKAIRTRMGPR